MNIKIGICEECKFQKEVVELYDGLAVVYLCNDCAITCWAISSLTRKV